MRKFEGFMHGVNLGGWLSQADDTSESHYRNFITESDIEYISSLGLDHVRIPVDYPVIEEEDGTIKPDGYNYLDNCLEWCRKYNLHMIIDLHKAFGYSFDPLDKTDKTLFFRDEKIQERFYLLWKTIAIRYGKYHDTVAFELLNEIVEPSVAEAWNSIALKTISEIRTVAPDSWVIFGGTMYNSVLSVPALAETQDDKVVYTFHSYEPLIFTHQGAYWVDNMPSDFRIGYPADIEEYRKESKRLSPQLAGAIYSENLTEISPDFFETLFRPALETAESRNIPLYCGEYGVIDLADDTSKINWTSDICSVFDKYGIGRAYWNYKEKDYGIINISDENIRKKLAEKL
ncbi:MAG: glycoside hydrolase family 5 protein [Ruminococcus sp.]|nr:glycoside hydrolase family 5 protein [Ruminococcus sp.]